MLEAFVKLEWALVPKPRSEREDDIRVVSRIIIYHVHTGVFPKISGPRINAATPIFIFVTIERSAVIND